MIPILYDKTGNNKLGELNNCIECLVEEERNGVFEVSLVYPINDDIFNQLQEENIIVCNANDTLKAQKFRIYATKKLMTNKVEVYARHISFDLAYDRVESINITNQSCEYALNTIFRQSQFSTNYRGHSDIVNAQDYIISNVNCIEAIAGVKGSIIDTYGTGAEILRDNTDIHVLNRRGHDNEVTIEYAKNLTGFELEEDYSELVTRINAFAKYTDSEANTEHIIEAKNIDSPLISNYSHPYISSIDYSDKFEQDEIPTQDKLIQFAKKEFTVNKKDLPKQNFKIEFIPLSKCVGYEELEDKISICDTVTIIDTRYDINTKAKVIRTVFNVLKDRYESMELGEPRTSLGDIIVTPGGGSSNDTDKPQAGPQGPPGQDGTDGTDGTDGEDAIYLNLTNDSHVVPTLFDGSGGNYIGCETEIELYKGADKIIEGVIYEAERIEGVTSSLTSNVYSITNMTVDSCNVALRATYNDKTYLKYFNVTKSKKGKDGTTYYTWIRYADDENGNGISNDPIGKEYIGFAYNKPTAIESNNPKDYSWSLIKGTDGVPGEPGENGETYYTWIRYSDNADGNPCYQQPTPKTRYIGIATNKTTATESDNPKDYVWSKFRGDDGVDGTDGATYYTWIKYANDEKGNGISNDPVGKPYIGFAYNKTTSVESNNQGDYSWSLIKGTDGVPGKPGEDGITYYTWIKYSDNPNGNPCYEQPTPNTRYIGIATNKTTATESNNPGDYAWSKFRGDDGVPGTNGKDAYTINITNDSHVFEAESNGSISKQQTTSTKITAFKGVNTVPFTIGELPSIAGLHLSKNETTVTISAVVGNSLADTGEFEIPIIVEGLQFKKAFSWSKAKKGQNGADGNTGDFPDSLPSTPVLTAKVYGFANIELSWTYENKVYYQYELYASKTRNFTPNTFDLIHQGQTSSFLYQARPDETWYFKVCAINSHGNRTQFSNQVEVQTRKVDDMSTYFEKAAIGKAVVGSLTADYMEAGIIKGNWIDAKNLSVTDGNGERTLDIDTFGNVRIKATEFALEGKQIDEFINEKVKNKVDNNQNAIFNALTNGGQKQGIYLKDGKVYLNGEYMQVTSLRVGDFTNLVTLEPNATFTGSNNSSVIGYEISSIQGSEKYNHATFTQNIYEAYEGHAYRVRFKIKSGTTSTANLCISMCWKGSNDQIISTTTKTFTAPTTAFQEYSDIIKVPSKPQNASFMSMKVYIQEGTLRRVYIEAFSVRNMTGTDLIVDGAITGDMLKANAIDGKTIKGNTIVGGQIRGSSNFYTSPKESAVEGYAFRIYANGEMHSDNFILTSQGSNYSKIEPNGKISCSNQVEAPAIITGNQSLWLGIRGVNPGSESNFNFELTQQADKNVYFRPGYNGQAILGHPAKMFNTVYSVNGTSSSSDRTLKENIRYLSDTVNPNCKISNDITELDLYDFVKNDLITASYNFIGDDKQHIGFIAQDLLYNEDGSDNLIGQIIVNKPDDERSPLSYNEKIYTNVLAGALRHAILKIEELETEIKNLKPN